VDAGPTIHASAVLVGGAGVLIRGPSGCGKSRLALELINAASAPRALAVPLFTRLVADDRVHVAPRHGRLLVWPPPALAGLIEVRGVGIVRVPYEQAAVVSLVVDIESAPVQRLPDRAGARTCIEGLWVRRVAVAAGNPLATVLAALTFQQELSAGGPATVHPGEPLPGEKPLLCVSG
jgi:HPr kinase/phosphorylase